MQTVTEEYDRRVLNTKAPKKEENTAFYGNDAASGSGKGKKFGRSRVECYNCKKRGHYKSECWAPGGGKEGQGSKDKPKPKEKGAAASDRDKEKDEAWFVNTASDNDADSLPDLQTVSDSSSEGGDSIPNLQDVSDFGSEANDDAVSLSSWDSDEVYGEEPADFTSHLGAMLAHEPRQG